MIKSVCRSTTIAAITILVALGIAGRLAPHPPNFAPVTAIALFAGYVFAGRYLAWMIPVIALGIGDVFLGVYEPRIMATVYLAFLVPGLLGRFASGRYMPLRVMNLSLASSSVFYLSTNFAVWLYSGMYDATWAGLVQCFTNAVPFLRYTISGDLVWSGVLFGSYALLTRAAGMYAATGYTAPRDATGPRSAMA
jgi:hypothetical protein